MTETKEKTALIPSVGAEEGQSIHVTDNSIANDPGDFNPPGRDLEEKIRAM